MMAGMVTRTSAGSRFEEYVELLGSEIGHADRLPALRSYLLGLLLPGDRKSVEPMAAKIDPFHVSATHQSMHHFVSNAPWDDREILAVARDYALRQLERHGPVGAFVVDDTGMPKQGTHSVGVARQYCGFLGKEENCQVAVTVSLVNQAMSVPASYRLYLPKTWAEDAERRAAAGIPSDVSFATKWQIALSEIQALLWEKLPPAPVLADAGYGDATEFREGLTALHLSYVVGVKSGTTAWPPGTGPLPPKPYGGRGPPPKVLRRDKEHQPRTLEAIALSLPKDAWKTIGWRDGTRGTMRSRFAAVRVRPAHRDELRHEPREIEWLLVEWPRHEKGPTKYWFSTVPENVELMELVDLAKLRWRIERDYEELKEELGLDHYEGRSWRGFHHHGVLCIAAHCYLAAERGRLSPPQPIAFFRPAPLPEDFRPRGAPCAAGKT
jgi:SRSO17 transposase